MTASDKARELVNMYYTHAKTQKQAIEICERVVLNTLCSKIVDLEDDVRVGEDYKDCIIPSISILKWWQEVAVELENIKNKLPV